MPSKNSKKKVTVIKNPISLKTYHKLLSVLRREIARGQERIDQYVTLEKIRTNWTVGRLISEQFLNGEDRAPQGHFLYARLGKDLNVSVRHLQDIVRFYRVYPKIPDGNKLTWTHYHLLIHIADPARRKKMQEDIIRKGTSVRQLRLMVRNPAQDPAQVSVVDNILKFDRGTLYAYRIMKVNPLHGKNFLTLDCGFNISLYKVLDADAEYKSGYACRSVKNGENYSLALDNDLRTKDMYAYAALIERFIDGDTLLVNVDVGFGIWTRQKLRFRGIDCPELGTTAGERAKKFVQSQLHACQFVVIKTHKSDKYDWYLVDVFYLPGEKDALKVAKEGKYLNQELIDRGLAKVWSS